jgi:hypothetical protein
MLTIATAPSQVRATGPGIPLPGGGSPIRYGLLLLPLPLLGLAGWRKRARSLRRISLLVILLLFSLGAFATGLTGCANIGLQADTETYAITVTGISGKLQHSVPLSLTVTQYKTIKY